MKALKIVLFVFAALFIAVGLLMKWLDIPLRDLSA